MDLSLQNLEIFLKTLKGIKLSIARLILCVEKIIPARLLLHEKYPLKFSHENKIYMSDLYICFFLGTNSQICLKNGSEYTNLGSIHTPPKINDDIISVTFTSKFINLYNIEKCVRINPIYLHLFLICN